MTIYSETRYKKGKPYKYYYFLFRHNGRVIKGTAKNNAHLRGEVVKAEQRARERAGKGVRITKTPLLKDYIENVYIGWAKKNKASWSDDVLICEYIKAFFGNERIGDITAKRVREFVQWRKGIKTQHKRIRTNATINREKSVLSKILSLAVDEDIIDTNPAIRVKPLKKSASRILYWNQAEEAAFLAKLTGPREHLRPIIEVFLYTGMRQKELFQLTVDRCDFENGVIQVRGFKTSSERIITMEPRVRVILREACKDKEGSDLVFTSAKTGNAITTIKTGMAWACREAKVKNIGVHGLRHTRGTRLALAGLNAFQIAAELGHTDPRMTQAYIHVTEAKGRSGGKLRIVEERKSA